MKKSWLPGATTKWVRTVKKQAQECPAIKTTFRTHGRGSQDTYTPKYYILSNNKWSLSLQQHNSSSYVAGGEPPGGLYIFTAEHERLSGNRTKMTFYALLGRGPLIDYFTDWSLGKSTQCPNIFLR